MQAMPGATTTSGQTRDPWRDRGGYQSCDLGERESGQTSGGWAFR